MHNIIIFTFLVNVFAWLGPLFGRRPHQSRSRLSALGVAPITAALIMKFLLCCRMGRRVEFPPPWRGNGRWYLLSLLLYPFAILAVLGIGWLTGAGTLNNFTFSAFIVAAGYRHHLLRLCVL
ncbi:MAG: hypothetical protein R3E79_60520 [Caldilineaceae bacterium]